MNTFTTKDGTSIFYKDWGTGPVVTFSHGWPLSADAWDSQMLFLGQHGDRVIAHDRRGHGRSGQTWTGNQDRVGGGACLLRASKTKRCRWVSHSLQSVRIGALQSNNGCTGRDRCGIPPVLFWSFNEPFGGRHGLRDLLRSNELICSALSLHVA